MDLCRDMDEHYSELAERLDLPVAYFRVLARSFDLESYADWKVVGWIEALNDMVYFLDLLQQIRKERDQRAFAKQLFAECEEKFFENSYLDDLFPQGRAQAKGLAARLQWLCMKLAREVTQESLFFDPRWAMHWSGRQGFGRWEVSGNLDPHFERAERAFTLPIGTMGDELVAPKSVVQGIGQASDRACRADLAHSPFDGSRP